MKPKYKFYVIDWNPNGTNDLIVRNADNNFVDAQESVLFGVDVFKLVSRGQIFDEDFEEFRISKQLIKKHVATCPIPGMFEENCKFLRKYGIK